MSCQSNPAARNLICSCTSSCVWKTFRACCRRRLTVDLTWSSAACRAPLRSYQLARATTAARLANDNTMNVRDERIVQTYPRSSQSSSVLLGRGIWIHNRSRCPVRGHRAWCPRTEARLSPAHGGHIRTNEHLYQFMIQLRRPVSAPFKAHAEDHPLSPLPRPHRWSSPVCSATSCPFLRGCRRSDSGSPYLSYTFINFHNKCRGTL